MFSNAKTFSQNTEPVFIIGSTRSGTSLLLRTLYAHSSFKPKKVFMVESLMLYHANQYHLCLEKGHFRDALIMYMGGDKKKLNEFVDSVSPILKWQAFINKNWIKKLFSIFPKFSYHLYHAWKLNGNPIVVRNFFYYAYQARQAKVLLEKSPNNLFYYSEILSVFPKSRLIYIHRHPVDTYSSLIRRFQETGDTWIDTSVEAFCQKIIKEFGVIEEIKKKYPQQLYTLSYESLTQEPEKSMKKLCTFLGEPYEKQMIEAHNFGALEVDKLLKGKIVAQSKKWQDYISVQQATFIEKELGHLFADLGYKIYTQ